MQNDECRMQNESAETPAERGANGEIVRFWGVLRRWGRPRIGWGRWGSSWVLADPGRRGRGRVVCIGRRIERVCCGRV